jgi:DNA primase
MSTGDAKEQIKDRLSIVDVVSPYVELSPAGKSLKGKSPFTSEKTPSFFVSPDRGMYYCFSTSKGGDIFTFVQEMEGVDFKGALKILAEKAGVELVPEDPKKKSEREQLYAVLEAATLWFEEQRKTHVGVNDYIGARGVSEKTRDLWRVGYAPQEWRSLRDAMHLQGYTDDVLKKAGLIKGAEGKDPYDVFRDRVMFPIFDASSRVIAFSGRLLSKETDAPKYVNSPETALFNKSEALYGYHLAKEGMRKLDFALIVEGQFDVVLSHQAGYKNTVAVSGTALTPYHVALLQRLTQRVVLSLDADRAGIAAVKRAASVMLPRGIDLKVVSLPVGKDPADMILEDSGGFKRAIAKAVHVVPFLLRVAKEKAKDERAFKLAAQQEVFPLLPLISNAIDREHFEGVIAEELQTRKDAVHEEVMRLQKTDKPSRPTEQNEKETVQRPPAATHKKTTAQELDLTLRAIFTVLDTAHKEVLRGAYQRFGRGDIDRELDVTESALLNKYIFELEPIWNKFPKRQLQEEIVSILEQVRVAFLKEAMTQAKGRVRDAEASGDELAAKKALETSAALHKQLLQETVTLEIFATPTD